MPISPIESQQSSGDRSSQRLACQPGGRISPPAPAARARCRTNDSADVGRQEQPKAKAANRHPQARVELGGVIWQERDAREYFTSPSTLPLSFAFAGSSEAVLEQVMADQLGKGAGPLALHLRR